MAEMSGDGGDLLFREVQRFRQPWLWVLVLSSWAVVAFFFGYDIVQQVSHREPGGRLRDPTLFFIGLGVLTILTAAAAIIAIARLETEVRRDCLRVRFFPFHRRTHRIPLEAVASAEARTYRPIIEYGGWGIRFSSRGKAYNVRGNRGLQLVFRDGSRLLIGSGRIEELARAVAAARGGGASA